MDFNLRCNVLRCRCKLTEGEAYVTCCSHIFCPSCAGKSFNASLTCPTCETSLTEPSDIILVELNPTDSWKSMILCGHRPETLMEICSRATSFWVYQVYQELVFKDMIQRDSENLRLTREQSFNSSITQLKSELYNVKEKISVLAKDYESERRKCYEVTEQLTEKSRQVKKLQQICDKLRKKAVLSQVSSQIDQSQNLHLQNLHLQSHNLQSQHLQSHNLSHQNLPQEDNSFLFDDNSFKSNSRNLKVGGAPDFYHQNEKQKFGFLHSPLSISTSHLTQKTPQKIDNSHLDFKYHQRSSTASTWPRRP